MGILDELEKRKTIILREPLVKKLGSSSSSEEVKIWGIKLETAEEVSAFKQVYEDVMRIYDRLTDECRRTHEIKPCVGTHIMGHFVHDMMGTVDKLREKGLW